MSSSLFPNFRTRRRSGARPHAGYTLHELLLTATVMGVVTSAAPPLLDLVRNNRLTANVNLLLGDIQLTRSEAIKRRATVTLCKSADGRECTPESDWRRGWIVFADGNNLGEVEDGETIIRVQQELADGMTMVLHAGAMGDDYLSYSPTGTTNKNGNFTFCDGRGASAAKAVVIYKTRPRLHRKDQDAALKCT